MKISIITVSFNASASIAKAIDSVISQSYHEKEHIVIDGGSTDGTVNILQNYRNHLSHLVSGPDDGIYDAMNKGLDLATGDVICFLNADDQYATNTVLSQVAQQMQKQELDALMGDVVFFNPKDPDKTVRRYRSDRFSPARLAWGWMPSHPALFMKRNIMKQVGYFKTDYRIAGDYEYVVRAFQKNTLKYQHLSEVLVRMQIGGISSKDWRSRVLLNQEVLRACRENGLSTNVFKILSKYPLKLMELFQS